MKKTSHWTNNKYGLTHGMTYTPTFNSWANMIQRCTNTKHPDYKYYGGRGIKICEEWKLFINFFNDIGIRPEGMTLNRIDNGKGYFKENCRWATWIEQQNNSRHVNLITFNGETKSIRQWAQQTGINENTIRLRISKSGWTIEEALTLPLCIGGVKLSL